jgi:hypothetical protein
MSIMLDLETTGVDPGSRILSIGVVAFRDSEPLNTAHYHSFYREIHLPRGSQRSPTRVNPDTLAWWARTNPEFLAARKRREGNYDQDIAVLEATSFMRQHLTEREPWVYCKGASFDFPILRYWIKYYNLTVPWNFWNEQCLRPIFRERGFNPRNMNNGDLVAHNALDDCKIQLRALGLSADA